METICCVLDAMLLKLGGWQLTCKLLVTLMAEVMATVNACPLTTVLSDTDESQPQSPTMPLTVKMQPLGSPPRDFVPADLYSRCCWRQVQYLTEQF